ncbi:MAG TPA: HlyD family type I secretion periplasmic adaptor subunit, partial [Beijerinckiaceae bacterium]
MSLVSFDDAARARDRFVHPARPALFGCVVMAAFGASFMGWSALAPVSGAAIAQGALQVEGKRQSVQHPYGGVVREIAVREGDRVARGQLLILLHDAEPRAKLDVLVAERDGLLAQEARLVAERDGAPLATPDELKGRESEPAVAQALAGEKAVMTARLRQFETEATILRQKIAQLQEQARGAQAQLQGAERQKALLEDEMRGARQLAASGYTPRTRILALERDLAKLEAERGAAASEIARAQEAVGEAQLAIARLERTRVSDIADQLRTTHLRLAESGPKIDAARDVLARTRILAPASGVVVGLNVFTEGGVAQPGARLLEIVPSDAGLFVEGRLHLSDVNEVTPGRRADVRLTGVT